MSRVRELQTEICQDLLKSVESWDGFDYFVTSFVYPDGDYITIYADGDRLSDRGTTMGKLHLCGLELTEQRSQIVDAILTRHEVRNHRGLLSRPITDRPGTALIGLCQALVQIMDLTYGYRPRSRSSLAAELESLLVREVGPHRAVQRDWHDPTIDRRASFCVDFRVNGIGEPRHLFHVGSDQKCDRVAAVCNFLRSRRAYAPTMAVIDDSTRLGDHAIDRLALSSDTLVFGLGPHADEVVQFAMNGVP